ncbi:LacI family DNA-binding transcriptional regulator [Streptomyces sp. NPDC058011]|uniref:LacI family DNA-binding transcriptional regulator n=1 Tax=Streptomyces sp. NPDC058011 TaxID=3346305 RepID=UPI0036ECBB21
MDVARVAGVSRATVSFVLNNTPKQTIPEATRRKVLEAAERLGYSPNGPAQALSRGRGSVVLLCLPDYAPSAAVGELVDGLDCGLAEEGLVLVTHSARAGRQSALALAAVAAPVAVVGLLPFGTGQAAAFMARGAQVVLPDDLPPTRDNAGCAVGMVQTAHLAERGHTRIGYVHACDPTLAPMSDRRGAGAYETARRLGLPQVTERRLPVDGDFTPVLRDWRTDEGITAIAAFNDDIALAVLHAAWTLGVRVPHELAVIGMDDIAQARYACPPLSTIRSSGRPFGEMLARLVLHRLGVRPVPGGDDPPAAWTPDIVIRQST